MLNYCFSVCLKPYNTLAIDVTAKVFVKVNNQDELLEALAYAEHNSLTIIVLSGGSNVVFSEDFAGLVIYIALQGVSYKANNDYVLVTAAAGENWHQLTMNCLSKGFNGLENLALIPGLVGAAPIQNIGAYGVELSDVFHSLKGWDRINRCWKTLQRNDCQFGYRDSVFKHGLAGKTCIVSVSFLLYKKHEHHLGKKFLLL